MATLRRVLSLALLPLAATGCLSSTYRIRSEELMRLSRQPAELRGLSVRAVQGLGTPSDDPPEATAYRSTRGQVVTAVGVNALGAATNSGLPGSTGPLVHPPPLVSPPSPAPASHGRSAGDGRGSSTRGTDAGALALLVVAGAVVVVVLAGSEGARYDGWIAVHPDEPLYLTLRDRRRIVLPLWALTPELAAASSAGHVHEGSPSRYVRLARAPLDRSGFGITAAGLVAGIPMFDGRTEPGWGGHFNVGGNIAGVLSVGGSIDAAAAGRSDGTSVLYANTGPELQCFPLRYLGVYAGAGYAFRQTDLPRGATVSRSGYYVRGGLEGEIPLLTRLAVQLRAGVAMTDLGEGRRPVTLEGSIGLAVY